jgi:hypothetical protein
MMLKHEPPTPVADLPTAAASALREAAQCRGLDSRGSRLIRLFATAVYHLPAADAVARISVMTSPETVARLARSVLPGHHRVPVGTVRREARVGQQPPHPAALTASR